MNAPWRIVTRGAGFSIGSLEVIAFVLALVGVAVALLTVVRAGLGDALVILSVPVIEAALPPVVHRIAPGSAHLVRVLACMMMLTWVGLSLAAVGYLFVPAAVAMVIVAVWSGRQRRAAVVRAAIAAQRRQKRGGQKARRKRAAP